MFGFITRAVFGLEVTEERGKVRISGIRAADFIRDINNTFSTTRVTVHMLNKATSYYVEFYSFFLIDIEYIVRKLAQKPDTQLGRRGYIKMHEALLENTWLSRLNATYPSIFNKSKLSDIKFSLLKHQAEFIDYYDRVLPRYNLKGILMAATPGSGKTISSIAVASCFEAKNVIVISPKNAVFRVWEKTLLEDMNVEQKVWVHASGKPMPAPDKNRWYIFHYESLGVAVELANRLANERCCIILDESHNLNEMKSLRTERFVNMCRMMTNSIIVELSGTPMKAMGSEAIPLISAIDPLFNDKCVEKFKKIYGREAKAATEILANRLGIIMYKVNKEESKIDEPIEHQIKVKVKYADRFTLKTISEDMAEFIKQRTEYYRVNKKKYESMYWGALDEFNLTTLSKTRDKQPHETYLTYIREFIKYGYDPVNSPAKALYCNDYEKKIIQPVLSNESRKAFKLSKAVVKYVDLKIKGECLGTVLSRARTECNKAILESLDLAALVDGAEKKTLVFTSYVDVVKAAAEKLTQQGYQPLTVFAETNHQLPQMVRQFGNDESINPLIATYQSLSTAVPLTMANRVILLNAPFRIHEKEQTVARANRIGQDKTVEVFNILLDTGDEPNISTRSSDIMEWSREQVNAIMGFDNSDNSVALESILVDEDEMNEEPNIIQETESDLKPVEPTVDDAESEEIIDIEKQLDEVGEEQARSKEFVAQVNESLQNGVVPSQATLESYWNINPPIDTVGLESDKTLMYRCVITLEQEKRRSQKLWSKTLDLIDAFFKAIWRYIKNANRKLRTNVNMASEMTRAIERSNVKLFQDRSAVTHKSAMWLTRSNTVDPQNHIDAMKWQEKRALVVNGTLASGGNDLISTYLDRLSDITSQPGLNQSMAIVKAAMYLNELLKVDSSSSTDVLKMAKSEVHLGGRVFIFKYPIVKDESNLLRYHRTIGVKKTIDESFSVSAEKKIEPLDYKNSQALLNCIRNTNKTAMKINSNFLSLERKIDNFIDKARKYQKQIQEAEPDAAEIAEAQCQIMAAVLQGLTKYTKEFIDCVDLSSRASFKYITLSAKGGEQTKPEE